jgi:plasmid stabilization system protein ParE
VKVRYTLRARADLDEIYAYLRERAPASAEAMKSVIERRISWLTDFPLMAPATDEPGIHELTLVRHPYKIYYEVQGNEVWIVHIRHTLRRPWQSDR